jgi:hypothetical protein
MLECHCVALARLFFEIVGRGSAVGGEWPGKAKSTQLIGVDRTQ